MYAPILLFVYNRPEHTRRVIESLQANAEAAESRLFIYADQARSEADRPNVDEVRRYIRNLVVSPYFLRFMNDALEVYKDEERVGHIQACDFTKDPSLPDTFLIKWTGSWGWATWARAWRHFNPDGKALLAQLEARRLTRTFDFGGNYPFTRMLRRQIAGKNNSWAIRWNASLFLAGILSLNVGKSLGYPFAECRQIVGAEHRLRRHGYQLRRWRPLCFRLMDAAPARHPHRSHCRKPSSPQGLRPLLSSHQRLLGESHPPHQADIKRGFRGVMLFITDYTDFSLSLFTLNCSLLIIS